MHIGTTEKTFLAEYIRSSFFNEALLDFLDEFGDPELAFRYALNLFGHVGPRSEADWGYYISPVFGVWFAADEEIDEITSFEQILYVDKEDPGAFDYHDDGPLAEALAAGIKAALEAIAPWVQPALEIDEKRYMAQMYFAMFLQTDDFVEIDGGVRAAPILMMQGVETVFHEIFWEIDEKFFPNSNFGAKSACKAFWEYFGLTLDDQGLPILWWVK